MIRLPRSSGEQNQRVEDLFIQPGCLCERIVTAINRQRESFAQTGTTRKLILQVAHLKGDRWRFILHEQMKTAQAREAGETKDDDKE